MRDNRAVKGMPRKKKRNILESCYQRLETAFQKGKGRSKYEDKKAHHGEVPIQYIYMHSTLKVYKRALRSFKQYAQAQHVRFHSEIEMYLCMYGYVQYMIDLGYSAWTIKTYVSGICKALGSSSRFIHTPARRRADIRRSRGHGNEAYLRQVAERYRWLVLFCVCVGPRKKKELRYIRGIDHREKNGKHYILIQKGKGGQRRKARIVGSYEEVDTIVAMCEAAGEEFIFRTLPSNIDIHALRAIYACRMYLANERPIDSLARSEKYIFKQDMKGLIADKRAMRIASESLGHHRINVIAGHYLWPLEAVREMDFSFLAA